MEVPELPREFDLAVARGDWEAAAYYAMTAAAEFVNRVGLEAAEALLDELEAEEDRRWTWLRRN